MRNTKLKNNKSSSIDNQDNSRTSDETTSGRKSSSSGYTNSSGDTTSSGGTISSGGTHSLTGRSSSAPPSFTGTDGNSDTTSGAAIQNETISPKAIADNKTNNYTITTYSQDTTDEKITTSHNTDRNNTSISTDKGENNTISSQDTNTNNTTSKQELSDEKYSMDLTVEEKKNLVQDKNIQLVKIDQEVGELYTKSEEADVYRKKVAERAEASVSKLKELKPDLAEQFENVYRSTGDRLHNLSGHAPHLSDPNDEAFDREL